MIDRIAMTDDVLTMTILIGEHGYPSLNRIGADSSRTGRKSKAYHALFNDVCTLGRYAVAEGWAMIEFPCDYFVRRYCMKNAGRDSLNIGHVEANALTAAGVWADDRLADQPQPSWVLDPAGPERVVITLIRKPQVGARKAAEHRFRDKSTPERHTSVTPARGGAILNGKPIDYDAALKMIRKRG